jgi:hypothetical protein
MPQHTLGLPLLAGQSVSLVHERTPVSELVHTVRAADRFGSAQISPNVVLQPLSLVQAKGQALDWVQALPAEPKSQHIWPAPRLQSLSLSQSWLHELWQTPFPKGEPGLPPNGAFPDPLLPQAPPRSRRTASIPCGRRPRFFKFSP